MKILFCTYTFSDYGLDTIYDGLCKVYGAENVLEYPNKPSLHGERRNSYLWYPHFFNYQITKTDKEKIDMLRNNKFDIILVGCRRNHDFRTTREKKGNSTQQEMFNILKETNTPLFLIDQSDSDKCNIELIDELKAKLYFKREYYKDRKYDKRIVPFNFSYSDIPIDTKKTNSIFWAGKRYKHKLYNREPYIRACEETIGKKFYNAYKQSKYSEEMANSRIGLNLKGVGNDTVRYYEIPAHKALLFSQKLDIVIENDFKDGETAIFFRNIDEMKEKLKYCLKNKDYVDRIRNAGYEHFKKYHTSKVRAKQLIDYIYGA